MRPPSLIEFIGLPGSGKSTIAAILGRELESSSISPLTVPEAGRTLARRSWLGSKLPGHSSPWGDKMAWKLFEIERLTRGIAFLLRRPIFSARLFMHQVKRPPAARRGRRVVHWWIRAAGARSLLMARRLEGEVIVLDEGLCHRVVQLFSSADEAPDPTEVVRYADGIPLPDVLIHVVAPVDVSCRRVLERGVWERMANDDEGRVSDYLASADLAISHFLSSEPLEGVCVVDVDNSKSGVPTGYEVRERLQAEGILV